MTSMFTFLTVREWDRLTSMIERGGIVAVGDVRDELTEIHGELVTGWQAEFYANDPASYERPAGAEVCRCGDLIERCTYPECLAHFRGWVHTDGRPAAHTCADRIGIAEPADDGDQGDGTDPGAFPVMGADWPAGAPVSGYMSHLHPRCTCTHPATAPCDLSCPVHRGHGSAR